MSTTSNQEDHEQHGKPSIDTCKIAVIVPCFNEVAAISSVVASIREHLPHARIYVYDNNSTDGTADIARHLGVIVRTEPQQGKGHVVRRMFADVEADLYVLVDGDDTYCVGDSTTMIKTLLQEHLDMVVANRHSTSIDSYRFGHRFGNAMFSAMVGVLFGRRIKDLFSGYRVFSRRFVKSFPALSTGFEIETELTIHALALNIPVGEISSEYSARPAESASKLRTFRDGIRILLVIVLLVKSERPLLFFLFFFLFMTAMSFVLGIPLILDWMETGLVPKLPTALLSASIMILGFLSLTNGLVLGGLTRSQRELKRLHYVSLPWLGRDK